jgi:hypothetical protein
VQASIELIEAEGQRRGLTERVAKLLAESGPVPDGPLPGTPGGAPEPGEPENPFDSESLEEP